MNVRIEGNRLIIEAGSESREQSVRLFNLCWSDRIPKEWGLFKARFRGGQMQVGRMAGLNNDKYNWFAFYGRKEFDPPRVRGRISEVPRISICDKLPTGQQLRKRK